MPPPRLRRVAESSGQPAPAGIEPGPTEVAEQTQAIGRDDPTAQLLAREAREGGAGARAEGIAELPPPGLLEDPTLRIYRLQSGQYRHRLTVAGNVPIGGVNQLRFPEEVRAGMLYVIRAIRAQAPAGAKLQLFENNLAPDSFREVISNVQEYSGEPPGLQVIRGPASLIAVITNTTAEGLALIRLEGDLVKREPIDT